MFGQLTYSDTFKAYESIILNPYALDYNICFKIRTQLLQRMLVKSVNVEVYQYTLNIKH